MIKFVKIEFKNYRQYKDITIDFEQNCENHIHVLRAKNGSGKTNFLNAVVWCLYSDEKYLTDADTGLPIINTSIVQNSQHNDRHEVYVRVTINDGNNNIEFFRIVGCTIIQNPMTDTKTPVFSVPEFSVTITDLKKADQNTQIYHDETFTKGLVKQYFDVEIFDYYFFDGENLKSYFTANLEKAGKIKQSIYNIAQVTMLESASKRALTIADEKERYANRDSGEDRRFYGELKTLKEEYEKLISDNQEYEKTNRENELKIREIDNSLKGIEPVKLKQKQRLKEEGRLEELNKRKKDSVLALNNFIIEFTILLNFYPLMKKTLNMINEKEDAGSLPPNIDKKFLQKILDEHIITCPVCQNSIDDRSIRAIKNLIDTLDVSSATSHKLVEIKAPLEESIERAENYQREKIKLQSAEKELDRQIDECENELSEISAFLSKIGIAGNVNVAELEDERNYLRETNNNNIKSIGSNDSQIKTIKKRIEELNQLIKEWEDNKKIKNTYAEQAKVLNKLSKQFDDVKLSMAEEIKKEIEMITWNFFNSMIWKEETFDHLKITDDYIVSVYNKYGNELTGSMSATERMALAYSFTFAIHEASGKNSPLIVDSPLGRVSDDNRVNMAKELLKVSKDKQIIMLFTPDEYSEEVRKIYDIKAGSVRDIILGKDESEIEKVGN